MNATETPQRYRILVDGMPSVRLASADEVTLQGTETRSVPVRVQVDGGQGAKGSNRIHIALEAPGRVRPESQGRSGLFRAALRRGMMMETTTTSRAQPPAPWYRHRWPWLIMLGPFLVVLAGSYTMWLAYSSQDALVVGDYYRQGKAINRDLTRDRAAVRLGLQFALRYDAASGRLLGNISGAGKAVQGPMTLKLVHSTRPEKDIVLPVHRGRGRQCLGQPADAGHGPLAGHAGRPGP